MLCNKLQKKREPMQCTTDEPTVPDQPGEDYEMGDDYIPDALDPPQPEFDPPQVSSSAASPQTGDADVPDPCQEVEDEEDGGIRR